MGFHPNQQARLIEADRFDPVSTLRRAVTKGPPWESIIDFATHRSFCGKKLYPRQQTLLKLIFLETHNMTAYDLEVINGWCEGFRRRRDTFGVQPDVWERIAYLKARGARRFPHILYIGGRRGSKGLIGGILGAEQLAYMVSLDDWQAHYGIDRGKDGYLQVGATNQSQAKAQLFADIRTTVEDCQYLQPYIAESKDYALALRTPADLRRIAEMKAAGVQIEHMVASVRAQALSANAATFRGATAFGLFLDEFAFMVETGSGKSGEAIYEDAHPSLDQFDLDGLTYIPTSPYQKSGKAYALYQEGSVLMESFRDREGISEEAQVELARMAAKRGEEVDEVQANPTMLVLQLPSWELYTDWERGKELVGRKFRGPIQPGPDHETQIRRKIRNPEKFRVEREAQWAEVVGQYFDPDAVDRMFVPPGWRPPLEPQSRGYLRHKYRIHFDPGRTGANFAMCIGHTEEVCEVCGWSPEHLHQQIPVEHDRGCKGRIWPHVIIDLLHVWKPDDFPPDPETNKPTIDYVQVQRDIEGILKSFPSASVVSFDQWNSAPLLAQLRRKFDSMRVIEVTFTERENQRRFERVKGALNLGWVHCYRDRLFGDGESLLENELKFLAERNGKVVKQDIGPVTTKDLADCFCVVVADLLHDALEHYSSQADMAHGAYGSSNISALRAAVDPERPDVALNPARQALAELMESRRFRYSAGPTRGFAYRDMSRRGVRQAVDRMTRSRL